jgi:hypothetical protein
MSSGLKCGTILGLKTLFTLTHEGVHIEKVRQNYYSLGSHPGFCWGVWKSVKEVMSFYTVHVRNDTTTVSY